MLLGKHLLIERLIYDFDRMKLSYSLHFSHDVLGVIDLYLHDLNVGIHVTVHNISGLYIRDNLHVIFVPESYFCDADKYNILLHSFEKYCESGGVS